MFTYCTFARHICNRYTIEKRFMTFSCTYVEIGRLRKFIVCTWVCTAHPRKTYDLKVTAQYVKGNLS
jgi:hypothetical protein